MTEDGVAELVARLFAAAGREFGETHLEVYADALDTVDDEVGREAARNLARHVSWERPPSVGLVVDEVNAVLRKRQAGVPALEEATGGPVTREQALAWVKYIRRQHGSSPFVDALETVARRQPLEGDERQATGEQQGERTGVGSEDQVREAGQRIQATGDDTGGDR